VDALRTFHADICFLGVCNVNPEFGLGIDDFDESHVKRATIASSAEVAGMVIAENLGTALPYGLPQRKR
jgi:DeoR/GlpR family transcriptional regulator of sugar metabolism